MCAASNTIAHLAYQAADVVAVWRQTKLIADEYMDRRPAEGKSPAVLFSLVLGWAVPCVMIDVLHTGDHVSQAVSSGTFSPC